MNTTTEPPPPPPPQPHRSSFSCDRHPSEQFTGFCPSCLCERLTTLDPSSSASSSRRPSNATATTSALKSIFRLPTATATATAAGNSYKNKPSSSSFLPELRRTKSFSASKNEGFSGVFEPQRKSCDVRVRNTLCSLFSIDDERKSSSRREDLPVEAESARNLGSFSSCVACPVFESREDENDNDGDEIRVSEEVSVVREPVGEIAEEVVEEVKRMKDHIDLDSQAKKPSGFWSAASGFGKKWYNWRQKQKLKKRNAGADSVALPVEKPISRQFRETQSEIADYGFGRRSCDTDPRFSLDAGRMSLDDPRYSFDEPRASWDGYLVGRNFPRLPPMLAVVEDSPAVHISRSDAQIPVEEPPNCTNDNDNSPGGSTQTRDYYNDSSSRRRKSLDRSSSIRKTAAAVVAEIDETKAVSNSKVSPATVDHLQGSKFSGGDKELRDSNSNSLRDDNSETFELGFGDNSSVIGNGDRKGPKKSRRWIKALNLWGFMHRRSGGNKDEDEERYSRGNGVERSFSESWQELRGENNGEMRGTFNRNMFRSNSSVSWRNSHNIVGSFGSMKRQSVETNGHGCKSREDFVLERNRSARHTPNDTDNGLFRFYLTPMRSSNRRGGLGKSKPNSTHSIVRNVLRLY
ncbi:protein OCTOPUS-like [Diospyros lotus]|uniref:protein OCTOPUS-like n=1 Tax=Diospyros lotus TaxID=55363 RepID=UPI002258B226|nr:protein OCTOPUS-like [Diospyros lotus]XP_052174101.1 protein OCTOPUS-like [Diospyros lotus]